MAENSGKPQAVPSEPEKPSGNCGPLQRPSPEERARREKMLDKTLADTFPTSDPPSSIPDPIAVDDSFAA